MKYIHIIVSKRTCDNNEAQVLVFDECNELINMLSLEYPHGLKKNDIYDLIYPNNTDKYSIVFDHVGSRPNDR